MHHLRQRPVKGAFDELVVLVVGENDLGVRQVTVPRQVAMRMEDGQIFGSQRVGRTDADVCHSPGRQGVIAQVVKVEVDDASQVA